MHTLFEPGERGFLITDVGRLIHKAFAQKVMALGYSQHHWQILGYLKAHPGTMQATLAAHMEVEPITLSRYLDRMESEGVLERKSDAKDRRVKRLLLTPKADEQLMQLKAVRDEIVDAIYLQIGEQDIEILKRLLTEVRRNLLDKVK